MLGLLKPDFGSIKINSQLVNQKDIAYKNLIGCLVDSPCLYLQLTPKEYLGISCKIKGLAKRAIDEALEIVNMSAHVNVPMDKFSLGMKQRIALANALLGKPKLLILDEPTNGLDPAGMKEIRHLLKSLPEQTGATVFLSSHLLDEIQKTASHVGILHQGDMKIESNLLELMNKQSSSLDLVTSSAEKLKQYFSQKGIHSKVFSSKQLRLTGIKNYECSDLNKQVVNAGFDLIESRFNQPSLENLFLELVSSQNLEVKAC